jgi:hypothetical protein
MTGTGDRLELTSAYDLPVINLADTFNLTGMADLFGMMKKEVYPKT